MATNDFILDLVEKLQDDNIEYMLVCIQKGREEHQSNAYYNITTDDGANMIIATVDEVINSVTGEDDIDETDPDKYPGKD